MNGHRTERVSLGTFPTPLEPAPRLAAASGLRQDRLWIKRDDLTGLGGGGNKVRKLERTVAAALRDGADCLVTTGAAQSNHARLTAAAGARLGLGVTLVLVGHPGDEPQGNLLLDEIFGARIRWAGDADDIRLAGHVLGVHTGAVAAPGEVVAALVAAVTAEPPAPPAPPALRLRTDQVGPGYASLTEPTAAAIRLAARTEGIVLDPTYTGRAMAGLIAAVRDGDLDAGGPVVFWHTGGLPGLFGHREAGAIATLADPQP